MNKRYFDSDSLERSHSPLSNFLLTLVCLLGAIAFSGFFAILALQETLSSTLFIGSCILCGVLAVLSIFLLIKFKR